VRGEAEPNCTGKEALSAMVLCEAVKRTMETGEGVNIIGFKIKETQLGSKTIKNRSL
jgi:hypothetical protein